MPTNRKKTEHLCRGTFSRQLLILTLALVLAPLAARATPFVLLYSNDNVGEIEPCG